MKRGDIERVFALETNNTAMIGELKDAINDLRKVINELGIATSTQAEAFKGIKEMVQREIASVRIDHQRLELLSTQITTRHEAEIVKSEARFKVIENRIDALEKVNIGTRSYWEGGKFVAYVLYTVFGGAVISGIIYALQHVSWHG